MVSPVIGHLLRQHNKYVNEWIHPKTSFDAVIHLQERPPHKRFLVGCSSPFMRLAEHLTAIRVRLKQWLVVWSVKTKRAPSRHCRDGSMVIRLRTAMHVMSTPPPSSHLVGER